MNIRCQEGSLALFFNSRPTSIPGAFFYLAANEEPLFQGAFFYLAANEEPLFQGAFFYLAANEDLLLVTVFFFPFGLSNGDIPYDRRRRGECLVARRKVQLSKSCFVAVSRSL